MATQPEALFKNRVCKLLDTLPKNDLFYFTKEAKSLRGIPDLIGCYKGIFFAWELKQSEEEAQKIHGRIALQRYILSLIRRSGGIGEIVCPENLDEKFLELQSYPKREDCPPP
jgi:hypothetical protein